MITPGGIKYEPDEDELDLPFDLPMLVTDQRSDLADYRAPVQRGHRLEVIHPDNNIA